MVENQWGVEEAQWSPEKDVGKATEICIRIIHFSQIAILGAILFHLLQYNLLNFPFSK